MTDQNRKTLRSFYCRDYLWEHFEQMAQELGCSMDYLINESMRLYARNRDFGGGAEADSGFGGGAQPQADRFDVGGQGAPARTFERVPTVGASRPIGGQPRAAAPPQPSFGQRGPGGPPPPPPRPPQPPQPSWQSPQAPPQPPQPPGPGGGFGADPYGASAGGQQPLYLSFNGNRYSIEKDKFVIGRGSDKTDLTIRDGNISRRHCAVIYRNGAYYIKDMGSTNGVEYRGNRIESKKIDEGDVFFLCDYELRFSYH